MNFDCSQYNYIARCKVLFIVVLMIAGCSYNDAENNGTANLTIGFQLAPNIAQQVNITKIELTITAPDITKPKVFQITNIDASNRTAIGEIKVPIGVGRTFHVKSYDGEYPILDGLLENVTITSEEITPLIINLTPIKAILSLNTDKDKLKVGDSLVVDFRIDDAPMVFGFTGELEFNESVLQPMEVTFGDFFGNKDDLLFMSDVQFDTRQMNRLNLGVTRKAGTLGVGNTGVIFRITFRAKAPGDASIKILRNNKLTLTDPEFKKLEDSRIIIGNMPDVKVD
jgi:hypothetical protein